MPQTHRHRVIAPLATAAMLVVISLVGAGSVLADGTCPGHKIEVLIPAEQRDTSPLEAYDMNGDGIVCQSVKGKKTTYSDNRL